MEHEYSLLHVGEVMSENNPTPARTEEKFTERVLGFGDMKIEGGLVGLGEKKVGMSEILDEIHKKALSIVERSHQREEMDKKLKEREVEVDVKEKALMVQIVEFEKKEERLKERVVEVDLKEKALMVQIVEFEKKEERLKDVEERERKIVLLEKSIDLRLEEAEKENDLKLFMELSVMKSVLEKKEEEREKNYELLSKLIDEKLIDLEKKKEMIESEQKAKDEEIVEKNMSLELKEKNLEKMMKELELKQREFQERPVQGETCKRSRVRMMAEKCSEADSPLPPASKRRSNHDDEDKGEDLASVVSPFASSSEDLNEVLAAEIQDHIDEEELCCVDPEFHDFKATMSSFVVGKVWALYDSIDGMPRLYGQIKHIHKSRSSVKVKWLCPKDEEESVPVACGRFKHGLTETMSCLTFSHEVHPIRNGRNSIVNPREGETWALFRDWSRSWNNNPEQHKPPYRYDLVEVISFDDHDGVGVTYLGKVDGFVSVFKHDAQHGVISRMISPDEMLEFSHRVTSIRLNGDEKEGVPVGSFELDPAAVPSSLLKLGEACEGEDKDGSRKDIPIILD